MVGGAIITFLSIFGVAYLLSVFGVLDQRPVAKPQRDGLAPSLSHERDSGALYAVNIQRHSLQRKHYVRLFHNSFISEPLLDEAVLNLGPQYQFGDIGRSFPEKPRLARERYSRYRQLPIIRAENRKRATGALSYILPEMGLKKYSLQ